VKTNSLSSYISSEFATLPVDKRLHLKLVINTSGADPLGVREQVALKMLLNAHSTALMTKLGRVVGNTMTNVKPSNLKLIGRATYLIQLHVNAVFDHFKFAPISYADTNAVLFEAIEWKKRNPSQSHSEVELAIVRILETAIGESKHRKPITWEETFQILKNTTLEQHLNNIQSNH
jgi:N-acetylmuramic acid 6-phosphate etherase